MTDPLSWTAMQSIKTRIESIRTSNGYQTDIGSNVHLDTVPLSSIGNAPRTAAVAGEFTPDEANSNRNVRKTDIGVTVEAVIPADYAQAEGVAHKALADMRLCLKDSASYLPPDASSFVAGSGRLIRRPDGADVVLAQMDFTLKITERTR